LSENDIGYSDLTGYQIQWDQGLGTGTFVNQSFVTATTATIPVTSRLTYQFKVAPVNIHGPGTFSASFEIIAADLPSQPQTVAVS